MEKTCNNGIHNNLHYLSKYGRSKEGGSPGARAGRPVSPPGGPRRGGRREASPGEPGSGARQFLMSRPPNTTKPSMTSLFGGTSPSRGGWSLLSSVPPKIAKAFTSTAQSRGTRMSPPPNAMKTVTVAWSSGIRQFVRSSSKPPKRALISPPRNSFVVIERSQPPKIAVSSSVAAVRLSIVRSGKVRPPPSGRAGCRPRRG